MPTKKKPVAKLNDHALADAIKYGVDKIANTIEMALRENRYYVQQSIRETNEATNRLLSATVSDIYSALQSIRREINQQRAVEIAVANGEPLCDVVLVNSGTNRIQAIKTVRELTSLGLMEAKDLCDGAPYTWRLSQAQADMYAARLREVGCIVDVRPFGKVDA
jgi:ribosomal protein L7/L12